MNRTAGLVACGLVLFGCGGGGGGGGGPTDNPPQVTAFTVPAISASLTVPITSFTATDDVGVTGYLVTEASTAPAKGDARWSATAPTSYVCATAGSKTLHAWAKDKAGNISTSRSAGVVVDVTAPTVSAFTVPDTSTSLVVPITAFTATDGAGTGVAAYLVTESSTAPAADDAGWSATAPANYSFTTEGAKTLYAWAKDGAGNVSTSLSDTVTITLPDTQAPTVTAFTLPATSLSLTVSITSFTATDNVGVTGYQVTESATAPAAGGAGWTASAPTSYTFDAGGSKTLHAWARDDAGNVSASLSAPVIVDAAAPAVTAFTVPATSSSLTVSISSFTATDDVGVTGYQVTETSTAPSASGGGWTASPPSSHTFGSAGSKTLYAWAKDAAGRVSAGVPATVAVDLSAPTVTAFAVPATSTSLTVTITSLTATDDVGVTGYLVTESSTPPSADVPAWASSPPASYTFAAAGPKMLFAWAKDAAGRVSDGRSASVGVDLAAPTVTAFTVPATATSLTVLLTTLTATDDVGVTGYQVTESSTAPSASGGGWTTSPPASYTFATGGKKTLYAWAKDAAGRVSASLSDSVDVDVGAPTVTAFTVPATSSSLTISITSFTATDDVGVTGYLVTESATAPTAGAAGWTPSAPTSYLFAAGGKKTLYAWAKDAAGRVSASRSASVDVDAAAPSVTAFTLPATSSTLEVPIASFTATDDLAVTGYLVTADAATPAANAAGWTATPPTSYTFAAPGWKTLYAWAKDGAGRVSASVSASVDVLDVTAPTIAAFTLPASATTLEVFITSFSATDDVAVTGYLVTESSTAPDAGASGWTATAPVSYTFATGGRKTLYAWAKDDAGNVSTSLHASVDVDVAPPTVDTFTVAAASTSLTVPIAAFTASDDVGVTGYLVTETASTPAAGAGGWTATAPTSHTFASGGKAKALYAWAKDAAGRVSASRSATVDVDVAAPVVTAFTVAATSASLTVPVTVFTATDDVGVTGYLVTEAATTPGAGDAGWSVTAPTSYTLSVAGSRMLYAWAKDAAGRVSASRTASVKVSQTTAWYAGDPHVHRSCGGAPATLESMYAQMPTNDLAFMTMLADMGNGEVQDATADLPRVDGFDDPLSTVPGRIMHWDAEWHWDPTYTQYAHQALGGHVVALGVSEAHQIWQESTYPIFQWAHGAGGIAGFAHMQYQDGFIPSSLTCCVALEYPVEVALGSADFVSEDVVQGTLAAPMNMDPEAAIQAYYRLLNTGFRPGLAAGTDYPCNDGSAPGALLTYVRIPTGGEAPTYQAWAAGIAAGHTVVSRNGHREFLDLIVDGTAGPGDEVDLPAGGGSVPVSVTWTANAAVEPGVLQLLVNGTVVASQAATTSPATLTASIPFDRSGWVAARRMTTLGHQVQTAAVFVRVDAAPIRASAADAAFFMQWIDNLLARTAADTGEWASYLPTARDTVRARYQAARDVFQGVLAASGPVADESLFTTELPSTLADDHSPYELGTRFQVDMSGSITGVRVYVGAGEAGVHTVRIWRVGDASPLIPAIDWDIPAAAARWVTLTLPAPLAITGGPQYTYVVSVSSPLPVNPGDPSPYVAQAQGFASGIVNGHLHAPAWAGVYSLTPGAMPDVAFEATSYFRDVVFVPAP